MPRGKANRRATASAALDAAELTRRLFPREKWKPWNVDANAVQVLLALAIDVDASPTAIADRLGSTRPTVSQAITALNRAELIDATASSGRHPRRVELTPAGHDLVSAVLEHAASELERPPRSQRAVEGSTGPRGG